MLNRSRAIPLLITLIAVIVLTVITDPLNWYRKPIKVGVLHSLTGTMAISEKSVANATLLAIQELNDKGGLLGRKIEPIIVDGQSHNGVFAYELDRLITDEKVDVIFGCWTSACRKTIKPIVEKYQHIFFYPVQYEGLEQSPNIIYTGATPNQQIIPAVRWAMENLGKRFFLVASDYVFPRAANQIIHDLIDDTTAKIVGEEYLPLGSKDVGLIIDQIIQTEPDVIINTINGDSNITFFKQLYESLQQSEYSSNHIPVISFSIGENELQHLNKKLMQGHYSAWNYFQSIESKENAEFVTNYKRKYGQKSVTSDPVESAYFSVYLWSQAVHSAESSNPAKVLKAIQGQGTLAPEGMVTIDPETLHTWKTVRIGQINENGQFDIVWDSINAVKPVPYPSSRSREQWETYLYLLFQRWNKNWEKPQ